jgi:hypothetical protein
LTVFKRVIEENTDKSLLVWIQEGILTKTQNPETTKKKKRPYKENCVAKPS